MILKLQKDNYTTIREGIYYFQLIDFPNITKGEWETIIEFVRYENYYHRKIEVVCDDEYVRRTVQQAVNNSEHAENPLPSVVIQKDYSNPFAYHATDVQAAIQILSSGKLLSLTRVCGKTGTEIHNEKVGTRYCDPADYYEYIMFGWGSDPVGDYVVLSMNFPSQEELEQGLFDAGIRFYFKYEDLLHHPGHMFDGYHAIKIKNELSLFDYLFACIVPEQFREQIQPKVRPEQISKVHYLKQRGIGFYEWNEKVYQYVSLLSGASRC